MNNLMSNYKKSDFKLSHGKGCSVFDTNGKEYLDFTSGIGVCSLGHANEKITKAISTQAEKLLHVSNLFATENDELLAQKVCEMSGLENVFFANSGAEANEGAIKLARKYSFDKYGEGRNEIVTLTNSFHGRTITTLKATGQDKFHHYFMPFTEGFSYAKFNDISSIKEKINEKTCAVMLELCQGEGGVFPADKDFIKELYNLCTNKDILLIVDEVQTGAGRTGKAFAFEHYDFLPDIVTLAKGLGGGLPIGAVVAGKKVKDTFGYGDHGSTFGGNPVSCAVANTVLGEMSAKFLAEVCEKGEYLKAKIAEINSPYIKEIRGLGLMIGFELSGAESVKVYAKAPEKGLLVLTAGQNTVRLLPPLIVTKAEIDKAVAILAEILEEI